MGETTNLEKLVVLTLVVALNKFAAAHRQLRQALLRHELPLDARPCAGELFATLVADGVGEFEVLRRAQVGGKGAGWFSTHLFPAV